VAWRARSVRREGGWRGGVRGAHVERRTADGARLAWRKGAVIPRVRTVRVPRILIVEDDSELRRVVGYALMDLGMSCEEAANGEEALLALCRCAVEGWSPDCVVLDIFMPGRVNGWGVLESMRSSPLWAHTPVVVLTGKAASPADVERAGQLEAFHLPKTARFVDELVELLGEVVGDGSVREEAGS
jgi:CheY-like chemotaxis protein